MTRPPHRSLTALLALLALAGCAGRTAVLEVSGSVMYEKPTIASITHSIDDRRGEGGSALVTIVLTGDPGLAASFDITPGIVNRQAMVEEPAGRYTAEYAFGSDAVGGPYSVLGRLRHEKAGEAVARDAEPIILSVPDRAP